MTFPPTTLWDSFGSPRHSEICGNETAGELTREGSVHQFVGLEPTMEVSRQNIKKINR